MNSVLASPTTVLTTTKKVYTTVAPLCPVTTTVPMTTTTKMSTCKSGVTCDPAKCNVKDTDKCKSISCISGQNCEIAPVWTAKNCKNGKHQKCACKDGATCNPGKCKVKSDKGRCKSMSCKTKEDCDKAPIWTAQNCKNGQSNKCACKSGATCDPGKCQKKSNKTTKCKSITCKPDQNCDEAPVWTEKNCKTGTSLHCFGDCKSGATCDPAKCNVKSSKISRCKTVSCDKNSLCNEPPHWTEANCKTPKRRKTKTKCQKSRESKCYHTHVLEKHQSCFCKDANEENCLSVDCQPNQECDKWPVWRSENCKRGTSQNCRARLNLTTQQPNTAAIGCVQNILIVNWPASLQSP